MAKSHSKRSAHRAQLAHRSVTSRKTKPLGIERQHHIAHLPQVKGKTLEALEFISAPEYNGISLSFRDKTFLDFKIETSFTAKADYVDQKTGKRRLLRKWPGKGKVR